MLISDTVLLVSWLVWEVGLGVKEENTLKVVDIQNYNSLGGENLVVTVLKFSPALTCPHYD